jgi:hypothetical protein
MAGISVSLKLDKKSQQFLRGFPDKFKEQYRKGLLMAMRYAEAFTKKSFGTSPASPNNPPGVITGHLRRSIQGGVEKIGQDFQGYLGSNVVYARPLELGRSKGGNEYPFIRPALEKNTDNFMKIITKELLRSV